MREIRLDSPFARYEIGTLKHDQFHDIWWRLYDDAIDGDSWVEIWVPVDTIKEKINSIDCHNEEI